MLYDEIQILEGGRDIVDIGDVERNAVERNDGRALVNMDILDPELLRRFEIFVGRLVGQLVPFGFTAPFRGVELDALELVLLRQRMQILQTFGTISRIEGAVENEPVRMALLQCRIAFRRV